MFYVGQQVPGTGNNTSEAVRRENTPCNKDKNSAFWSHSDCPIIPPSSSVWTPISEQHS